MAKSMINPSVDELTQHGKYNRYTLCIATAKCAREVTGEYLDAVENHEIDLKDTKTTYPLRDEKAVGIAVGRLKNGEYKIVDDSLDTTCTY